MSYNNDLLHETVWSCFGCDGWWLSQNAPQPDSWHFIRMPSVTKLEIELRKPPIWLVRSSNPSICPDCGFGLTLHITEVNGQDASLISQS